MFKRKTLLFVLVISLLCSFITGCGSSSNEPVKETISDIFKEMDIETGIDHVKVYIDTETTVQYFVYQDNVGHSGGGDICPRYNPDGTLYTDVDNSQGVVFREIVNDTGLSLIKEYEDIYTGVHYFVYQDATGQSGGGGIIVRLENNMKLYTTNMEGTT